MSEPVLLPCPCGKVPSELSIGGEDPSPKWALMRGDCCADWYGEFRNQYEDIKSPACMSKAIAAWNALPRASTAETEALRKDAERLALLEEAVEYVAKNYSDASAIWLTTAVGPLAEITQEDIDAAMQEQAK